MCGVRDRSKMVLLVDPATHACRLLDAAAKSEKAALAVKDISSQVSDMEMTKSKGKKVPDKDILNLIEQLMTQLIKLDGVVAEGRRPEATKRNAGEESAKVCGDTRCAQDQECQDRDHAAAAATTSEATAAAATVTGEIGRNCNCGGRVDVDGDWCSFGWLLGL